MSLKVENIKKMMGWCPNARTSETRRHINFESFESGILDREKGDDGYQKNLGWLQKLSNYTLLINTLFTLVYIIAISHLGLKIAFFLAGFFISVALIVLDWKKQMRRYDILAQKLICENPGMKKVSQIINLIFYAVLFYWIFSGNVARNHSMQVIISLMGGFLVGMWLGYFQLTYWQRKNHKIIYLDKSYGKWKKSYIIRENK
ncbi:hypothetical protein ASJ81_07640 [Methanosarcina spelaei]|uniref:DUF1673 domain-containing protein n=1 Tax=Methanosarcina spelaei TaxID=1036679 RepID=A0A2A2HS86_9EURY|nr:DUF1673 domain-containing protein [Methanosarcina spelaei]PAV12198.1 hypothetical protein ASJ81_07640 [Methanosarcina spelaei]